ncbi:hypothetical protein MAPG_00109 [Magnaporthiopsis poae ATCC 64411]|uniref:Phospholipase/carboxylesterase/thioesterase domain-containing protein n=1 Tax=Magnaporthiopsis poae (strain ATCC 64411 / 73-15) TaxID=644358 RepID=A0A0C4DK47_MAGP6|nr:hypothetical protein MAPG_00109 [Magnaporthiopsis poae ATCC 64411]
MDGHGAGVAQDSLQFGPSHIIEPQSEHTHTAIVLHGRGSLADEFASDFLVESTLSDGCNLRDKLPGWRWVFPSSKELWSTVFQEHMPAWFEAHSLTDPTARQDLQVGGLLESVNHISRIIEEEIERLGGGGGGSHKRLVLGGISQGGAVAMWTLLSRRRGGSKNESGGLGAFFAADTWLPFAADVNDLLASHHNEEVPPHVPGSTEQPKDAILAMIPPFVVDAPAPASLGVHEQTTPVFLGHGTDDAYVDVELGRQAAHVLAQGGWTVEWKEYAGAEEEGHWFKVPDEINDIFTFLVRVAST